MDLFPPTYILRHRKENKKKCSLFGLEKRKDLHFFTYPTQLIQFPPIDSMVCLALDGDPLSEKDRDASLLLVDGTWRLAKKMEQALFKRGTPKMRSLPKGIKTAYPRRQDDCPDTTAGLASIEALYVAYTLLGRSTEGLLDHYHWKEDFLQSLSLVPLD